jgi:hypothetical protein
MKVLEIINNKEFQEHFNKWNFFDYEGTLENEFGYLPYSKDLALRKPGQLFLFENFVTNGSTGWGGVYYPKLAVFLSYIPCDQTVEIEYSLIKRTYQLNKDRYLESEIKRDPQWVDYHLIYDVWNSYPTWKELRRAYERTWWFHKTKQQKRDIKINNILNE